MTPAFDTTWICRHPTRQQIPGATYTPPPLKKQNRARDEWLLRQCRKRAKLARQIQNRRRHRNRQYVEIAARGEVATPVEKKSRPRGAEIALPAHLDLDDNYSATVRSFNKVRGASERRYRLSYLNFDQIRLVSPSAALLLASEIDRWNESIGGRIRAQDAAWDPDVKRLLCEMGLFELLNLKRPAGVEAAVNTTFLPFMRGNVEDRTHAGERAKLLRQQIEKVAGTEIKKHLLFDGLTEAVTNVCHHAYRKRGRNKRRYRPWWMFAAFSRDSNRITVSFYDHGLTIPGTLPASEKMERWRHRLGLWDDGQKIRAAMTIGRSATGKKGRGKGLRNFLELITVHSHSRLKIFSRNGVLTVTNPGNNRIQYRSDVLETSLRGTLIEWQFNPIQATDTAANANFDR